MNPYRRRPAFDLGGAVSVLTLFVLFVGAAAYLLS